jgi:branched-chain amino acid transport system ATP-binding protein
MAETKVAQPVLDVSGVNLSFGGAKVLTDVALRLAPGEVVALIGPNGAGKSALLNCLSGIYTPAPGAAITLSGQRIEALAPHKRARVGLARTFQRLNLLPDQTVLENVLLGWTPGFRFRLFGTLARPFAALADERRALAAARDVLAHCGLTELAARRCGDLPLGTLRRVDLARALIGRPRLLMLDEPASGLSHEERPLIGDMVRLALSRGDLAVLWIEHDLDLVLSGAHRAVVLHHGEVIGEGDPRAPGERSRLIDIYKRGSSSPHAAA